MDDAHHLHDTTDAAAWAKEFCKRWPSALCQIPGKEGVSGGDDFEAIMVGWFANAIMAGVDSEARGSAARIRALEAQLAAPVAVKVKPLVWECLGENHWRAKTPFPFTIRAENYGDGFAVGWSVPGFSDVFVPGRFAGIEAAKAATLAEYHARILAAVEAVPVAEVWHRAMEAAAQASGVGTFPITGLYDDLPSAAQLRANERARIQNAIRALPMPDDLSVPSGDKS